MTKSRLDSWRINFLRRLTRNARSRLSACPSEIGLITSLLITQILLIRITRNCPRDHSNNFFARSVNNLSGAHGTAQSHYRNSVSVLKHELEVVTDTYDSLTLTTQLRQDP